MTDYESKWSAKESLAAARAAGEQRAREESYALYREKRLRHSEEPLSYDDWLREYVLRDDDATR